MYKPTENKPKWEEQLRLSLYNFKACSPDYNEINIQEIKDFIQEQIEEAYNRGFEDGKNDIFKQNKVTLTNNNE